MDFDPAAFPHGHQVSIVVFDGHLHVADTVAHVHLHVVGRVHAGIL